MPFRALLSACLLVMFSGAAIGTEIAVLTPSSAGMVGAENGMSLLTMPTAGFSELARNHGEASRKLTELAAAERFDVTQEFTRAIVSALTRKNHTATLVPIKRRDRIGPMSRDEIPESPGAPLLLDIAVYYAGIYSVAQAVLYEPAVFIDYRWVDSGGTLVRGTRTIQYNKYFERFEIVGQPRWVATPGKRSSPNVVVIPADGSCKYRTLNAAHEHSQELWKCLISTFEKIGEKIAEDVPATAGSGDLRSDMSSR